MPVARVHRISAASPDDVSGIEAAIAKGEIDPSGVIAIVGKTEGNGCVNDFTRGFAAQSLTLMLQRHLPREAADKVCLVMSGGTEGGMAPHWIVLERSESSRSAPDGGAWPSAVRTRRRCRPSISDASSRSIWSLMAFVPQWRMPASPIRPTSISCRSNVRC